MKKILREMALQRRDAASLEVRREKSEKIKEHVLHSEAYQEARRVFSFVSMGSEVETRGILEQAWQDGKTVAVPKTERGRSMYFLPIQSLTELREGRFGVMEPFGNREQEIIPCAGDLFLVPGVLFDEKKNRSGYGGGYYDMYFAKYQGYLKIGLAFSFQVQKETLPVEETDIPLDDIVTENGWMGGR